MVSLFRAAAAAAAGTVDAVFGERVLLVPRVSSEFSGFLPDASRTTLEVTAKIKDAYTTDDARGEAKGFQSVSQIGSGFKAVRILKSEFASVELWPIKNDGLTQIDTGECFTILDVQDVGLSLRIVCSREH